MLRLVVRLLLLCVGCVHFLCVLSNTMLAVNIGVFSVHCYGYDEMLFNGQPNDGLFRDFVACNSRVILP